MKIVLERAVDRANLTQLYSASSRDVEIVGVKFCEYDKAGWLSVWMPGGEDEMPVDRWLIGEAAMMDRVRVWSTREDIEDDNWVYQCERVSIVEDD